MSQATGSGDEALLQQSRALGDPTRLAIFATIRDAGEPLGVAELTNRFGLNHNAIRQHLAKLRAAGLVIEAQEPPSGPGRPRLSYRVTPGASDRWGGSSPFETLSMLLLELLTGGETARDVGRRAGRRLADEHGTAADTVTILDAVARRMGFEPRVSSTRVGADVVLERCPFLGPAGSSPEVVCDLHLGIAEGIAERASDHATITELVIRPPKRAGCRIKVDARQM